MSPPYRSQLCFALGPVSGASDPITITTSAPIVNEDHMQSCVTTEDDNSITESELDEMIQDLADTQWVAHTNLHLTNISSLSMYTPYESEPRHAPNLMYGTENPTASVLPNHSHVRQVIRIADEQLAAAQTLPTATRSGAQVSCSGTLCRWPSESAPGICGAMISCGGVPTHFKDVHGIKNINESKHVECKWERCSTKGIRKYFVRHTREVHFGHSRDGSHSP